jgi:hypothetical protein
MIGQDSFLDVVTNIVGIIILLVMVMGMRASQAVETTAVAERETRQAAPDTDEEFQKARQTALDSERDVRTLINRVVNTRQETMLREQERLLLNTVVADAEQEIARRRSELNSQDQQDFDIRRQLNEAQLTLDELTREQMALLTEEPDVEEIQCEPTPLARVVSGKEVHLLLADDHVAVVPFEELLELLKADAEANVWRLRDQDELERTVGPVNGFRLRYWFVKAALVARNNNTGTVVAGQFPRFSHCFFIPVTTPAGEPAPEALHPKSEMRQFLGRLNPQGTTVTIWTYPGNYDRLREVKRAIREQGFQIALRPLPKGMPIGASRTGTESVTE